MIKNLLGRVLAVLILLSGMTAQAQPKWKISSVEAGTSLSTATSGSFGGKLVGLDMGLRIKVHYAKLPDGLDFSLGLHERRCHWIAQSGPKCFLPYPYISGIYGVEMFFYPTNKFFNKNAMERFLISLGFSYTKELGRSMGWTSDVYFMFSPISKSEVPYDAITYYSKTIEYRYISDPTYSHDFLKEKNGFTPGLGIKTGIWWKLPIQSSYDFRVGLNIGYEYLDMLEPLRNINFSDILMPFSSLPKKLNNSIHAGLNFTIGLN